MAGWFTKGNAEWAVELYRRIRGNALARNAGYLVLGAVALFSNAFQAIIALIASAFGHTLEIPETPWWVAVIFALVAAVLLLADRKWPEAKEPAKNRHDILLIARYRALITEDVLSFLRDHSFGWTFPRAALDPVSVLRTWKGPRFEFVESELKEALRAVIERASTLDNLVSANTWMSDNNPDYNTAFPAGDETDARNDAVVKMDAAADQLVMAMDDLERLAQEKGY